MNWIFVTQDNVEADALPKQEVLAIGNQNEMLVGWLKTDDEGVVICETGREILYQIRGYIISRELVEAFKQKEHEFRTR